MNEYGVISVCAAVLVCVTLWAGSAGAQADKVETRVLRNGRLHIDDAPVFLKIGKPLRDFSSKEQCDTLIGDLGVLRDKHFNALSINCYWHHFDHGGDGEIDVSLEPLRALLEAIVAHDMFPILSIETYGVGGGLLPRGFWEKYPDAVAVNAAGLPVSDTEYGFGSTVPSHFSPDYLRASRHFIRNLVASLDTSSILFFETSVEPQYIGNQDLCFSAHGRRAYEAWLGRNNLDGPDWPEEFPASEQFLKHPVWNRFRAEALADWVNGDAAAFREGAGRDIWIAVDYLETGGPEMPRRNGDSRVFLRALDCADIIQVNWHWHLGKRAPNLVAYENMRAVMSETGRAWAVTEHMTLNGSDFRPEETPELLRNVLRQGTRFAWEFTNIAAATNDPFCLYHDDWSPKATMAVVDEQWDAWMEELRAATDE